jgi:putative tricarboxylic transport membrane protein
VVAGMWFSRAWPPAAKFVPDAACLIALFFAALNLATEIFGDPAAAPVGPAEAPQAAGAAAAEGMTVFTSALELRGVRFFLWLIGFLVLGAGIGLLPALCLLTFLLMRFEFTERWLLAAGCSAVATLAIYLVFDRIFALPWPQSLIGDLLPGLRDVTGLV